MFTYNLIYTYIYFTIYYTNIVVYMQNLDCVQNLFTNFSLLETLYYRILITELYVYTYILHILC